MGHYKKMKYPIFFFIMKHRLAINIRWQKKANVVQRNPRQGKGAPEILKVLETLLDDAHEPF